MNYDTSNGLFRRDNRLSIVITFSKKMAHPSAFKFAAELIIGECGEAEFRRKYITHFGIDPVVTSKVWDLIKPVISHKTKPSHLLWALLLLKTYNSEEILSSLVGRTPKTFRKHAWYIIESISKQAKEVVSREIILISYNWRLTHLFSCLSWCRSSGKNV